MSACRQAATRGGMPGGPNQWGRCLCVPSAQSISLRRVPELARRRDRVSPQRRSTSTLPSPERGVPQGNHGFRCDLRSQSRRGLQRGALFDLLTEGRDDARVEL